MIDRIGIELPDVDAVREEARRRAFLMLTEGYKAGEDRRGWTIRVSNVDGIVVLSMTLAKAIEATPLI